MSRASAGAAAVAGFADHQSDVGTVGGGKTEVVRH